MPRALENNGIKTLKQLSQYREQEVLKFLGNGPPLHCPN